MVHVRRALCAVVLVCSSGWVRAGAPPQAFTLGQFIPDDVWLYVHEIQNPEREFINEHWYGVWRAALGSGIDKDLKNLIISQTPEPDRPGFEAKWDQARDALFAIAMDHPGRLEFAIGQRVSFPMPSYVVLFRDEPSRVEPIRKRLSHLLDTLASCGASSSILERRCRGGKVRSLCVGDVGSVVELIAHGDITGIAIGRGVTDDVLKLMSAKSSGHAIVDNPTFLKAMRESPDPEDAINFFRWSHLFAQTREAFRQALKPAKDDPDVRKIRDIMFKAMGHADILEYTLSVRSTDGQRETETCTTKLGANAKDRPLVRAVTDRKPFRKFDRFVPIDATGFTVSTAVDFGKLYDTAIDFILEELPNDGPPLVATFEAFLDARGFNLRRDVFSWLSGEYVAITLPGPDPTSAGFVLMVRTKAPKLARQKINAAADWLGATFEPVMVSPAPAVRAKGFQSVFHPMMMMARAQPVIGVYEDWVVVGSRARDVNRCLKTARGAAPSIRENARFQKEGLWFDGDVVGASFQDLTHRGEELAMAMGMLGVAGGSIPATEELKPIKTMFSLAARLAPVLATIDFQSSGASVTRFTGDGWINTSIVTYKLPKAAASTDEP